MNMAGSKKRTSGSTLTSSRTYPAGELVLVGLVLDDGQPVVVIDAKVGDADELWEQKADW